MGMVVMGTLSLVSDLLGTTLAVIGLESTGNTIAGVGNGFLGLVLGGLGGVRDDLLLGLCGRGSATSDLTEEQVAGWPTSGEVLASGVRHDEG